MFPNIKAEIARNNMSYKKVAAELNVSVNTIKNWMTGRTELPSSKIVEMSRLFDCTTDYLLGNEQCQHKKRSTKYGDCACSIVNEAR